MFERNNGTSEANILQNQFTAYLLISVRRTKARYLRDKAHRTLHELPLESLHPVDPDMMEGLPLMELLENHWLRHALGKAKKRELYILLVKALEDRTFVEIAGELGISPKTVASAYYRLIRKIRRWRGGGG